MPNKSKVASLNNSKNGCVTRNSSISYEIGAPQERDWCQNFSLGHNFGHSIVDCSQNGKKWLSKLFIIFGRSPRIGLYLLKLVSDCKEISAKISVLVTILCIKSLSEAKE